jgi:hypothetical protein
MPLPERRQDLNAGVPSMDLQWKIRTHDRMQVIDLAAREIDEFAQLRHCLRVGRDEAA